jgi:hypothetical protein
MSQSIPDWLTQPRTSNDLPDWLTGAPVEVEIQPSPESRALLFSQYEMALGRILELIASGYTLKKAFKTLPIVIDSTGFAQWLRKNPKYYEMYKSAKEIRTEAWADEIIRHAEGKDENGDESMADTARSRLIVDTYWKLMGANNRKEYGDTKTIEMNTTISISAALAQAQSRVIEAQVIDDDVIEATDYKQLGSGDDEDDE